MPKRNHHKIDLGILIGLVTLIGSSLFAYAGSETLSHDSDRNAQISVVCAPERPVVFSGESVQIRAWVTNSSGNPLTRIPRFTWSASVGEIAGAETATWKSRKDVLKAGELKREVVATVLVTDPVLGEGKCTVNLIVAKPPKKKEENRGLVSGGALLLSNSKELAGYGLYSYLLFDSPPKDDSERKRYRSAVESYLRQLPPIKELERHRARSSLNITLLPVKLAVDLPEEFSDPKKLEQTVEKVLGVYDYARAQILLDEIGKEGFQSGPYMFSRRPIRSGSGKAYLFFNMSRASPKLVSDWMDAFRWLTAQERSWNEVALKKLALNMRNVIAVSSVAAPEVLSQLQQWIRIIKSR